MLKMSPAALNAALSSNLENMVAAMTPGGIEAQEHAGQMQLCAKGRIPREGCDPKKFEQMGVVFSGQGDDLFLDATLPNGWSIKPTEHSMWSDLIDDKGRKRAAIFYKAAFYDRSAHISLTRRYSISGYEACDKDGNPVDGSRSAKFYKTVVKDGDSVIYSIAVRNDGAYSDKESHYKDAEKWLDEHFPQWKDAAAYWD